MDSVQKPRTAIVMAGGGTRGAYEAGVVHYIRTMLPADLRRGLTFQIHCGSSVGAINASFMAGTAQDPEFQGRELLKIWLNVRPENIYRTGAVPMGRFVLRSLFSVLLNALGVRGLTTPEDRTLQFRGIFDTAPFTRFLFKNFRWPNITRNIEAGIIDALSVSATNMITGDIELFLQKRPDVPHSDRLVTRLVRITPRHVMASAAIPLLFPPVPIHGSYYADGGMRLNTPLAPAVSLGANRILIVGTRHTRRKTAEEVKAEDTQALMLNVPRPTLGELLGKFFNAILLDRVEADRDQVERINRILHAVERHTAPEDFRTICEEAKVKPIETISIIPTVDIHSLVDETVRGNYSKVKSFSAFERFLLRILEADPRRGRDLLSYFLFDEVYLKKVVDLGFEDARQQHDALCTFAQNAIREQSLV